MVCDLTVIRIDAFSCPKTMTQFRQFNLQNMAALKSHLLLNLLWMTSLCVGLSENACPNSCRCLLSRNIVDCTGALLHGIPYDLPQPASLLELILKRSSLQTITSEVGPYDSLVRLDLSFNEIQSIRPRVFFNLRRLEYLNLQNNHLANIESDIFLQQNSTLLDLDLSFNEISAIVAGAFDRLSRLGSLDLSHNQLSSISSHVFVGLTSLRRLDVSHNKLTQLDGDAFVNVRTLRHLSLSYNRISDVKNRTFSTLIELVSLDLANNEFSRLPEFVACTENGRVAVLTELTLKSNRLAHVPSKTFKHLPALMRLDLSDNLFTEIEADSFSGLFDLEELTINNCARLEVVRNYALSGLHRLKTLNLAHNDRLASLHSNALDSCNALRSLNIQGNTLTSVAAGLTNWVELSDVNLSNNHWTCNCDLFFLVAILRAKREELQLQAKVDESDEASLDPETTEAIFNINRVLCEAPEQLQGKAVADLTTSDFAHEHCPEAEVVPHTPADTSTQFSSKVMVAIIFIFAGLSLNLLSSKRRFIL